MATPTDQTTTHHVRAGDLDVQYREWGIGEPVIALHGWPETSYEWRDGRSPPRRKRPLAGHRPRHSRPRRYDGDTRRLLASPARARCRATHGRPRDHAAPVIAHDWGGIIAFKLAVDHPARVTKLALLDTITTGWPTFVDYYYWFMVPGLAEQFFAEHAEDFISTIIGRKPAHPLPDPPACPFNMPPELLAARPWATEADVEAYVAPYRSSDEVEATCRYYRSLQFHRVIPDGDGERYEPVPHEEMAARWLAGTAGGDHLDYAIEDRHKTYDGPTLWLPTTAVLAAAADDPAMAAFGRHFPNLTTTPIESGHFLCEEAPEPTAAALIDFLDAS